MIVKVQETVKGQAYKTAEIILLCHNVLCFFCIVTFTSDLIAKKT